VAETELVIGIGCQRGTPAALLARGIEQALRGLSGRVCVVATIDRKRDEPGLLQLAHERGWRLEFHSAQELGEGVAEPAARRHGRLLIPKRVYREPGVAGSMTLAVAELAR
jgi:cobalamin biosynthesis protein CbiG